MVRVDIVDGVVFFYKKIITDKEYISDNQCNQSYTVNIIISNPTPPPTIVGTPLLRDTRHH